MLSITKLIGAAQVKDYFQRHYTTGDYYVQHRQFDNSLVQEVLEGQWTGSLTELLGLHGPVTKEKFYKIVDKINPETGEYLGLQKQKDRKDDHKKIVGYDITFNCPKSLSNQYVLTGDQRLLEMFHWAVRTTIAEMESDIAVRVKGKKNIRWARDNGIELRRNSQGTLTKRVGNGIFAEFTHTTNRPEPDPDTGLVFPDPHLHAHFVLGNFAYDADYLNRDGSQGAWLAIDIETMKQRGEFYQARFHSRLSRAMSDLGYSVERRGDGFWDLRGYTRDMIAKTSRRKDAIEKLAEKLGITGDKDAVGKLARETRRHKSNTDISWTEILELWHGMFDTGEWGVIEGIKHRAQGVPIEPTLDVREAVNWACRLSFATRSTVTMDTFREAAYIYAQGQLHLEDIDTEIWRRLDNGELYQGEDGGDVVISTQAIWREEQFVLAFAGREKGAFSRMGPVDVEWQTELFSSRKYNTAEQEDVAMMVLRSHDRVISIKGPAGAGKTALTEEVVVQLERAGRKVVKLGPSGRARKELAKAGFKDSSTLARFLVDRKYRDQVGEGDVIWLDEAGLVGSVDMAQLFRIAEEKGARIILAGDTGQHEAVARGTPLAQLEDGIITVAALTEIRRQEPNPEYLRVAELVSQGKVLAAFEALHDMKAIVDVDGWERADYLDRVAIDYVEAITGVNRHGDPRSVLVVSPSNREREEVTAAIRSKMIEFGLLGEPPRTYGTVKALGWNEAQGSDVANYRFHVGQGKNLMVRFHQNTGSSMPARGRGKPFFNAGGMFEVVAVGDEDVTVRDSDGVLASLPLTASENFAVYQAVDTEVRKGEILKITQNTMMPRANPGTRKKQIAVSNGDTATVSGFRKNGDMVATVEDEDGHAKEIVIPAGFKYFDHGYVVTSVGSQGATVDEVMIAQTGPSLGRAASAEQFYVSVTRGRENVTLYTSDQARLIKRIQQTGHSLTAIELKDRGDTDLHERRRREISQHRDALVRLRQGRDRKTTLREVGREAATILSRQARIPKSTGKDRTPVRED